MRAVIQRVESASVTVDNEVVGAIGRGLLVLLGVTHSDSEQDAAYLAGKIAGLRIFEDEKDKMNLSVKDVGGNILSVSQFTLFGDCRHGRRPSFTEAASGEKAEKLYECFNEALGAEGIVPATGRFQAHMKVSLVNDGPVTVLLDSGKQF